MAFARAEYKPCRSCLDVRCQNKTVIKVSLSVIQKEKRFWKFSLTASDTDLEGITCGRCLWCTQEVAGKPAVQAAEAMSDRSDIKKSVCSKKATHSSERAAERNE